jgi:F420-dependent oxidoreductase-like protein
MFVPQGWRHDLVGIDPADQWDAMSGLAAHADVGPWESIWGYDHFHTVPVPSEEATHEAWSLMSAFGATTTRIRLGQMCTCMSYRNPAYLAKVAATIDVISGGRVEMGIGAGWYEHEWRAYGYGFPRAGERLARLDEGVRIMKQAWTTGSATLDGAHYQVDGAIVRPLPLQEGGIPMWIAGGGEKVTLRIAARYADYTNFAGGNPAVFTEKSELLRAHCADVCTDFDRIVRSTNLNTVIAETETEVRDRLAAIEARWVPSLGEKRAAAYIHEYEGSPGVGTPEQVAERLAALRDLGLGYAIHYFPEAAYDRSGIELFEREVMPALG